MHKKGGQYFTTLSGKYKKNKTYYIAARRVVNVKEKVIVNGKVKTKTVKYKSEWSKVKKFRGRIK